MAHQLNVRSNEACQIAREIAELTGRPVCEVVLTALREYGAKFQGRHELTPTQRAEMEAIRAIGRAAAKRLKPGIVGSDHSDMYDEFGLPF